MPSGIQNQLLIYKNISTNNAQMLSQIQANFNSIHTESDKILFMPRFEPKSRGQMTDQTHSQLCFAVAQFN
jgi:hypothetical protein